MTKTLDTVPGARAKRNKKRPSFSLDPRILEEIERRDHYGSKSAVVEKSLRHWFELMRQSKRRIDAQLSPEEKGLILDATNGSYLDDDFTAMAIHMTVEEAIEYEGLDEKWGVESPTELVEKLKALTPIECFALAEALQEWWATEPGTPDLLLKEAKND